MAISTYAELQSAIADWLDRADLGPRILEFIALAEAQLNRTLRVRRMLARSAASLDAAYTDLPDDFLQAVALRLDGGRALEPLPAEELARLRARSDAPGRPRAFGVQGDELELYPTPDRAYDATLLYYARTPALSVASPSNWILTEHPDAYLYGALVQAAPYLKDGPALAMFNAGYEAALEAIRAAERTAAARLQTEIGAELSRILTLGA